MNCRIEGCFDPPKAKQLCNKHYVRLRRHGSTDFPTRKPRSKKIKTDGRKECVDCGETYPMGEFYRASGSSLSDWRRSRCKKCHTISLRNSNLLRKYGITVTQYNAIYANQAGLCMICNLPQIVRPYERVTRTLVVDHDHSTGRIRGLLCDTCNRFLGLAKDDPNLLRSALAYLELK